MAGIVDKNFPCDGLVPKNETGVLNFLKKYPKYNGEGVTIAIFDSGVDPRAAGMQKTPDGMPKVIERYDCSGCGDVNTSKKVTITPEGTIIGLSGRTLTPSARMLACNQAGSEYRIGLKCLYDIYPTKIRERIVEDEKLKVWDPIHKSALANVQRQLNKIDAAANQNQTLQEKLRKLDLENSVEYLNGLEKKYADLKVWYDCVLLPVAKGGWLAVIDTTETGDLENGLHIEDYSRTFDIQSVNDILTISINVHDDGDVLELVGMCSSHGTHVASIASGNHSQNETDKNELDGIAPAAKIVSLSIGDNRLGTMETGSAAVRAMIKVMELCEAGKRIHVINMSYGEHGHWSNSGRIGELMAEVVNKYGVVWVASAGNQGPALCTIGTPPDIIQPCCIGVGAYVSPEMMEAEYVMRQKLPANAYTWSSRDPCIDGGQGVTICAPGAAIASVPQYTLSKQQLMNGTSMAAPHVAGAIAVLISGLLKENINYSPFSIKRAVSNTATKLDYVDKFAQGSGLLNVEKAFEHLVRYGSNAETMLRFSVEVGPSNTKGIHLRRSVLSKPEEFNVRIEPVFMNDKEVPNSDKVQFNMRLTLVPSESWVQCGAYLDLSYGQRTISVRVDPSGLPVGVHTAKITAYDSMEIEKGSLFEIPITAVQPQQIDTNLTRVLTFNHVRCKPNTICRYFIYVPSKATWAVLKLRLAEQTGDVAAKFLIHTVQILPHRNCKSLDTQKILPVSYDNDTTHIFQVKDNNIVEVCIAKYWSNYGETLLNASIEFHGIQSNGNNVMHSGHGIHRIDIHSLSSGEEISPCIQLKYACMILRPSESKISPLTSRDVIPNGRQIYQNILTYNLHLVKAQEASIHCPLFSDVLYESIFESQLWMIFDSNKMLIASNDAFSYKKFIKLEKGDYVIRLQVRGEQKDLLEKISEATLKISFKLTTNYTMELYKHYNYAITNKRKCNSFQLANDEVQPIYVAPISNEKLIKLTIPANCSWLEGSVYYAKDEAVRKIDVQTFIYILTEGPAVKKPNGQPKETKSKLEEYQDGLRDFQITQLPKLELDKAEEIYKSILESYPKYMNTHIAFINKLEGTDLKNQMPFTYQSSLKKHADLEPIKNTIQRIIDIADIVINETDINGLLAYYGMTTDNRPDSATIKTNMEKEKQVLLEAYVKKMIGISKMGLIAQLQDGFEEKSIVVTLEQLNNLYTEIGKFIDCTDLKVILATIWHSFYNKYYGRQVFLLQKLYDDKLQRDVLEETALVLQEKKWLHAVQFVKRNCVAANPTTYQLF